MKIPKNINKNSDVELTTYLPGQDSPFIITGTYISIEPYALAAPEAKRVLAAKAVNPVVRCAVHLKKNIKTSLQAKVYDMRYGTDFCGALRVKRAKERDVRFAAKIGL